MRRRYRPPMTGAQRVRVFCFFLAVVLITLGVVGTVHLRGLLGNLAETAVSNMVGQVVTEAVSDTIANGDIRYERLISFEKDNNGDITALHSNMAEFNRLQAGITQIHGHPPGDPHRVRPPRRTGAQLHGQNAVRGELFRPV